MNHPSTLSTLTLLTVFTVFAGSAGCDEGTDLDPETAAQLLADEAIDPELLAELDIEEPELMDEPERDPDAPVCLVFVPSADEREANPDAELESRCYESRAAMESASNWLDNPHTEQPYSTQYYLGEGFEHTNEGGASYVFISSKPCGAGTYPVLGSLPVGWNDRISSYTYLPSSWAYSLTDSGCNGVSFYEHSNFGGSVAGAGFIVGQYDFCLVGQSMYFHSVNLTKWDGGYPDYYTMNDRVSSLKWHINSCNNGWNETWDTYTGWLSGANDYENEPNTYYYAAASARHRARISTAPIGTDFDLRLWWWNGSAWTVVASSLGSTSFDELDYSIGASGYYWWSVQSYSGSGSYDLKVLRIP